MEYQVPLLVGGPSHGQQIIPSLRGERVIQVPRYVNEDPFVLSALSQQTVVYRREDYCIKVEGDIITLRLHCWEGLTFPEGERLVWSLLLAGVGAVEVK